MTLLWAHRTFPSVGPFYIIVFGDGISLMDGQSWIPPQPQWTKAHLWSLCPSAWPRDHEALPLFCMIHGWSIFHPDKLCECKPVLLMPSKGKRRSRLWVPQTQGWWGKPSQSSRSEAVEPLPVSSGGRGNAAWKQFSLNKIVSTTLLFLHTLTPTACFFIRSFGSAAWEVFRSPSTYMWSLSYCCLRYRWGRGDEAGVVLTSMLQRHDNIQQNGERLSSCVSVWELLSTQLFPEDCLSRSTAQDWVPHPPPRQTAGREKSNNKSGSEWSKLTLEPGICLSLRAHSHGGGDDGWPNWGDRYPVASANWTCGICQMIMTLETSESRTLAPKCHLP